jgi:hypothetical protein
MDQLIHSLVIILIFVTVIIVIIIITIITIIAWELRIEQSI